jgi:hypothetical protein
MIDRNHELAVSRQARELGISRGSVYYLPRATSTGDLVLMRRIDELHLGEALASAPASGNNGKNRFADHASRNTFIHAFIDAYNRTRLRSLCSTTRSPSAWMAGDRGATTSSSSGSGGRSSMRRFIFAPTIPSPMPEHRSPVSGLLQRSTASLEP